MKRVRAYFSRLQDEVEVDPVLLFFFLGMALGIVVIALKVFGVATVIKLPH